MTERVRLVWNCNDSNGFIKAYECFPHDLIIAKLEAYKFGTSSLRFLFDYLSCREQRTKMWSAYSNSSEVFRGIPQGSILGSLQFNIFTDNIFFFIEKLEICNFDDDSTMYAEATSKTWTQTLKDQDPKNLDYEKRGKQLDAEKR